MFRVLLLVAATALGACSTTGGTSATGGAPLTAQQSAFAGNWSGRTPNGSALRISVSEGGDVSYVYRGRSQRLSNVKLTASLLSMNVEGSSRATLKADGTYVFTYGPTGEVTRLTLTKG